MSIREWAYNKFTDRNNIVSDDDIIEKIQNIFRNAPAFCFTDAPASETVMRWLNDGMTPDEYHRLYLILGTNKKEIEHLNPKMLSGDHVPR